MQSLKNILLLIFLCTPFNALAAPKPAHQISISIKNLLPEPVIVQIDNDASQEIKPSGTVPFTVGKGEMLKLNDITLPDFRKKIKYMNRKQPVLIQDKWQLYIPGKNSQVESKTFLYSVIGKDDDGDDIMSWRDISD